MIKQTHYLPPNPANWRGRIDGISTEHLRWHQHIQLIDLTTNPTANLLGTAVLLGFCCDEGVRRNKGRIGAYKGPESLRKALANLPVHTATRRLADAGDVVCSNGNLEQAQEQLARAVSMILQIGGFPILLGGGHEITYGHYRGIRQFTNGTVGIINFDAHFDNRVPDAAGPSSGTGFWQIVGEYHPDYTEFGYLAIGIQKASNTRALFDTAERTGTSYITATDFHKDSLTQTNSLVDGFIRQNEHIYLTIDMDVFAAAFAPGVSAPAYNGILPDHVFLNCLNRIIDSGKLLSIDIAELNPDFDIDDRTARLAAFILHHIVEKSP